MSRKVKNNACEWKYLPFEYYNCQDIQNAKTYEIVMMAAVITTVDLVFIGGCTLAINTFSTQSTGWGIASMSISLFGVFSEYQIYNIAQARTMHLDSLHFIAELAIERVCSIIGLNSNPTNDEDL